MVQIPIPGGEGFAQCLAGQEVERAVHPTGKGDLLIRWSDHLSKCPAIRVFFLAGLLKIQPEIPGWSIGIVQAVTVCPEAQPMASDLQQVCPRRAAWLQVETRHLRDVVKALIQWILFPFEPGDGALIACQRLLETGMLVGTVVSDKIQQHPQPFCVCQVQQFTQVGFGAKARFDAQVVADVVPMVAGATEDR